MTTSEHSCKSHYDINHLQKATEAQNRAATSHGQPITILEVQE